jgi:hypothetical protein
MKNVVRQQTPVGVDKTINMYSKMLNSYLCCFASSVYVFNKSIAHSNNTHLILQKVFEILASGSLLLYPLSEKQYIKRIGLIHKNNCYLIDFTKNVQKQINQILNPINLPHINRIRYNGHLHAINNLSSHKKYSEIKALLNI